MAGTYEVLGNFLLDKAAQMHGEQEKAQDEARQERLIGEQRAYNDKTTAETRAYTQATKLEDDKRAISMALIQDGLLDPAQAGDPAALSAAWAKTTPEYKVAIKHALDLKAELASRVAAGDIQGPSSGGPIVFDPNDTTTLETAVQAARENAGQRSQESRGLETKLKESQIAENTATANTRVGGEQRAQNAAWWTNEANTALDEYQNARLSPDDIKQAQADAARDAMVVAAAASGKQKDIEAAYGPALQKAAAAILQKKQQGAYLRAQNAQSAARVGAAIPTGANPNMGSSVAPPPVDPNAQINGFIQSRTPVQSAPVAPAAQPSPSAGASVQPTSMMPPASLPGAGGFPSAVVSGQSVQPLSPLQQLAPLQQQDPNLLPPNSVTPFDSVNPINIAQIAGTPGGLIANYRRPLAGSSIGNPYQAA